MRKIIVLVLVCAQMVGMAQRKQELTASILETNVDPAFLTDEALLINNIYLNNYHKLTKDSLLNDVLPLLEKEKDSLQKQHADVITSIQYYYANCLYELSAGMRDKLKRGELWKILGDTALKTAALPGIKNLQESREANRFLHYYVSNELTEVFLQARETGDSVIVQKLNFPLDSLRPLAVKYGESFLGALYALENLPSFLAERYLANQLLKDIDNNGLMRAQHIYSLLKSSFNDSRYLSVCLHEINKLSKKSDENQKLKDIVFIDSLYAGSKLDSLIAMFKGKVVYLDFWGSWCGPCITELSQYTPALKEEFKAEKELVFLYLAMEVSEDLDKWKQAIFLNKISGYHLVRSDINIEPFWVDLLGTEDVPRSYPTYAIFDREGELVTADAYRPSQGEALYLQLKQVLKKGTE